MSAPRSFIGHAVESLPTPCVLIQRTTLQTNVDEMAAHTRALGVELRPHWKTSKSAEVAQLQLDAGAAGMTAATANEVEALAGAGVSSIFWAYPPVGPERVRTAVDVARRTHLIVGLDSVAAARPLSIAALETAGAPAIDVRLEVDTGLGRTGVSPADAVAVATALHELGGIRVEGVFTHEGQVQGVGADPEARLRTGVDAGRVLVEVAERIRSTGIPVNSVSVGSTAGARSAPTVPGVTEARPGTYVYGDENQVAIGTVDPSRTAMAVLSRVISVERRSPVLIDAGIKAMSSDGSLHGDGRIGTVVAPTGGIVTHGNEEHGFLRTEASLRVGDLVQIRPNHACGLTNMHSHVYVVDDDVVTDVWPVLARH
ncbi:MAG: alanine racemase [Actinomycetota bacterium]